MIPVFQIVALLLVATAWAFALAHAAEYPGKMRLGRDDYLKVQTIYYPGFTIGGASEPLAMVASAALLAMTPLEAPRFWLILLTLLGTIATQAVFWLVTQPVNRIWTRQLDMGRTGAAFFSTGGEAQGSDWTQLRDRWERSHIARALLMTAALVSLVVAITAPPS